MLPDFRTGIASSCYQVSSVCPSGTNKMSMQHIPPMLHTHHYGVYVTHL